MTDSTEQSNNFFIPVILLVVSTIVIVATFYENEFRSFLGSPDDLQTHAAQTRPPAPNKPDQPAKAQAEPSQAETTQNNSSGLAATRAEADTRSKTQESAATRTETLTTPNAETEAITANNAVEVTNRQTIDDANTVNPEIAAINEGHASAADRMQGLAIASEQQVAEKNIAIDTKPEKPLETTRLQTRQTTITTANNTVKEETITTTQVVIKKPDSSPTSERQATNDTVVGNVTDKTITVNPVSPAKNRMFSKQKKQLPTSQISLQKLRPSPHKPKPPKTIHLASQPLEQRQIPAQKRKKVLLHELKL